MSFAGSLNAYNIHSFNQDQFRFVLSVCNVLQALAWACLSVSYIAFSSWEIGTPFDKGSCWTTMWTEFIVEIHRCVTIVMVSANDLRTLLEHILSPWSRVLPEEGNSRSATGKVRNLSVFDLNFLLEHIGVQKWF